MYRYMSHLQIIISYIDWVQESFHGESQLLKNLGTHNFEHLMSLRCHIWPSVSSLAFHPSMLEFANRCSRPDWYRKCQSHWSGDRSGSQLLQGEGRVTIGYGKDRLSIRKRSPPGRWSVSAALVAEWWMISECDRNQTLQRYSHDTHAEHCIECYITSIPYQQGKRQATKIPTCTTLSITHQPPV